MSPWPDIAPPTSLEQPSIEAETAEEALLPPLPPSPRAEPGLSTVAPLMETPRQRKLRHRQERKALADTAGGLEGEKPLPLIEEPSASSRPHRAVDDPGRLPAMARYAYPIAAGCALVWAGSFAAFVIGFGRLGPFDYAPFRDTVVGAMAVLPALFILLFAYALRQGARLGQDVRSTRRLSEDLVGPVAVSAAQTGDLMRAMRAEIALAAQAADDAERRLAVLRGGLSEESRRLVEAAQEAQAGARTLGASLGHEREGLEALSSLLEARTADMGEALGRQTRLAADVSDLAQAQLAEAQAGLVARTADLAAAAADVREGAAVAADLLSQQGDRLDVSGGGLAERLVSLSEELTRERERLAQLADALTVDQESFAARAESRHARMADAATRARVESEAASLAAVDTTETLEHLVAQTAAQVRGAAETAAEAHRSILTDAEGQLTRFTQAAEQARTSAAADSEQALATLAAAAEGAHSVASARLAELQAQAQTLGASTLERIEQFGEAAFVAGQRADQAFDARISAAKRAIDQSAAAVEEAGLRSAQRIEAGLAGAKAALTELDSLLSDVDGRFSRLPEEARERADAVRSAVERGVGDLTAAARRAAEETQAIDEAFQERVRRNYDTLSEAVKLMGRVAGAVDAAARVPEPAQAPDLPSAEIRALDLEAFARAAAPAPSEPIAESQPVPLAVGDSHIRFIGRAHGQEASATDAETPVAAISRAEIGTAFDDFSTGGASELFAAPGGDTAGAGLRPRLKLTPDPAPASRPVVAEPRSADGWSWKDLLSTLPAESPGVVEDGDEALADRLIGEIEALGLDVTALLPRAQVEDIALSMQAGRSFVAREGVRRLAPAAVRRLSRRVLTDPVLRQEADQFVRRYAAVVDDAAGRDQDGLVISSLLGSDAGRAFLMLDAAIGDLAH